MDTMTALIEEAPGWLAEPMREFLAADGGNDLVTTMRLLLEIEREHGWKSVEEGKRLNLGGPRMRPAALGVWVKNGRARANKRLKLVEAEMTEFMEQWWTWWAVLQSPWRLRNDEGQWIRTMSGVGWDKLNVPGQNGLLSVVAVLSWWKSYVIESGDEEAAKQLEEARLDVDWAMSGLLFDLRGGVAKK